MKRMIDIIEMVLGFTILAALLLLIENPSLKPLVVLILSAFAAEGITRLRKTLNH